MTAAQEWFGQFGGPGTGPGTGVADDDPQWCWRHWAPAPVLGYRHVPMMLEMTQLFIERIPVGERDAGLAARVSAAGRICCQFGDEVMYELWQHWPP